MDWKDSYRLENILKYLEFLPSIPVAILLQKNVFLHSAHLAPEVEAFRKKAIF